jgi:ribose 5-phosphate isomerase B
MIAIASDHVGLELKKIIIAYLEQNQMGYHDFGAYDTNRCNYPEYALKAANAVSSGECDKGIIFCGTGVGISIAANKVKGIRCVVCSEPYSAYFSRLHNDTNMLALGSRVVGPDLAIMIVENWLKANFEGGRHAMRVAQITQIEESGKLE